MPIIFENIDNKQTLAIDRELEGKYYGAKLSAAINSSNMSTNRDRGQDFGWRLQPEQQALIEEWEIDPDMIDKVSTWSKVPIDMLSHGDFLGYMLRLEERGRSPERVEIATRRISEAEYQSRVDALKSPKSMAEVQPMRELSLAEFLGNDAPAAREAQAVADSLPGLDDVKQEYPTTPAEAEAAAPTGGVMTEAQANELPADETFSNGLDLPKSEG